MTSVNQVGFVKNTSSFKDIVISLKNCGVTMFKCPYSVFKGH